MRFLSLRTLVLSWDKILSFNIVPSSFLIPQGEVCTNAPLTTWRELDSLWCSLYDGGQYHFGLATSIS